MHTLPAPLGTFLSDPRSHPGPACLLLPEKLGANSELPVGPVPPPSPASTSVCPWIAPLVFSHFAPPAAFVLQNSRILREAGEAVRPPFPSPLPYPRFAFYRCFLAPLPWKGVLGTPFPLLVLTPSLAPGNPCLASFWARWRSWGLEGQAHCALHRGTGPRLPAARSGTLPCPLPFAPPDLRRRWHPHFSLGPRLLCAQNSGDAEGGRKGDGD